FRRNFTPVELFGITFSIIGLVPSLASVLVFGLPYGGTSSIVWGWTVCAFFLTAIALAIAELGSSAPTSGGLYYWTFKFSSPRWRRLLCWIVGYSNTTGNIAAVASVDWGCAVQITAAASIGSGLTFEATTAQAYGVYCALLLSHAVLCSLNPLVIARLQKPYIVLNIVLCLVFIIGLPIATPKEFMNDAKYVFGTFRNVTDWNDGAFDSTIHISEEARNANVAIPFALIAGTVLSIVIGWGVNVALAFCMGTDIENILSSPIGQPMATILFNSFGQKGTLAVWSGIIVVQYALGTSIASSLFFLCSGSSDKADGALPLSKWLYKIDDRTHAPTRCVWFTVTVAGLLGLLSFAGSNAIGAVFTLAVVCQYIVYCIPISARFLGGQEVKPGPFRLGKLSLPIAIIAVTFMTFFIVVFLFPADPNPGAGNMNYTVVVLGGALVLSIIYYFFPKYGGRHWFTGPVRTLEAEEAASSRRTSGDTGEKEPRAMASNLSALEQIKQDAQLDHGVRGGLNSPNGRIPSLAEATLACPDNSLTKRTPLPDNDLNLPPKCRHKQRKGLVLGVGDASKWEMDLSAATSAHHVGPHANEICHASFARNTDRTENLQSVAEPEIAPAASETVFTAGFTLLSQLSSVLEQCREASKVNVAEQLRKEKQYLWAKIEYNERISHLEQKLDELATILRSQQHDYHRLKNDYAGVAEELRSEKEAGEKLREQVAILSATEQAATAKSAAVTADYSRRRKIYKEKIAVKDGQIQQMQTQLYVFQGEKAALAERTKALEDEQKNKLRQQKLETAGLRERITTIERKLIILHWRVNILTSYFRELLKDNKCPRVTPEERQNGAHDLWDVERALRNLADGCKPFLETISNRFDYYEDVGCPLCSSEVA
ncbi:hypothetical protein CVT26_001521, partial [Gymnopilus dilepis]